MGMTGDRLSGNSRVAALAAVVLAAALVGAGCGSPSSAASTEPAAVKQMAAAIVPEPVLVRAAAGVTYSITSGTGIETQPGSAAAAQIGDYLAGLLRPSTGYPLPVQAGGSGGSAAGDGIRLLLSGAPAVVGSQGYQLDVTSAGVTIRAEQPAGLFAGVQTLRQLLPAKSALTTVQPGTWPVPGGHIVDYPRYGYRGAMLDVSRHFFGVAEVEQYIDEISLYKINYLHLHLSDDQGWRIAINGWPKLTTVGASSAAGGSTGGYFTQADYKAIVAYAQSRYITIIPELDMPAHVDAALSAYPELGCLATAPVPYTSIQVAGSTLCDSAATKKFVGDVIGQIAALTPGPYVQIGGDEATATPPAVYCAIVSQTQAAVLAAGKIPIGWDGVADAPHSSKTILEYWHLPSQPADPAFFAAAQQGAKVIMAPADHAYLDQMYQPGQALGLDWAGFTDVGKAYDWDPTTVAPGVPASSVLGVEAPLWTETLGTMSDLQSMAFPRLPAIAEIGWSPLSTHNWASFSVRLGAQAPLWNAMGIDFYHSLEVTWQK